MSIPKKINVYKNNVLLKEQDLRSQWLNHFSWGITFVEKQGRKYNIGYTPQSCRGYLGENIFCIKFKTNNLYRSFGFNIPDVNLQKNDTYLLVTLNTGQYEHLQRNIISLLHKKEEQAKVKKSVIIPTHIKNVYIIKGSKYWKDSAWKIMLYSFYIKCCCFNNPVNVDPSYWLVLTPHEDKFLAAVKMAPEKEIASPRVYDKQINRNIHNLEGFISIARGLNPPMSKLLGLNVQEIWPINVLSEV